MHIRGFSIDLGQTQGKVESLMMPRDMFRVKCILGHLISLYCSNLIFSNLRTTVGHGNHGYTQVMNARRTVASLVPKVPLSILVLVCPKTFGTIQVLQNAYPKIWQNLASKNTTTHCSFGFYIQNLIQCFLQVLMQAVGVFLGFRCPCFTLVPIRRRVKTFRGLAGRGWSNKSYKIK